MNQKVRKEGEVGPSHHIDKSYTCVVVLDDDHMNIDLNFEWLGNLTDADFDKVVTSLKDTGESGIVELS